jgi:replicative superfamily II helicase
MNIFKRKLEQSEDINLPIHPIDLYQQLFHVEGYAYLRGIQEEVLNSWHAIRSERDVLCKMNTGSGKTLVSLLMLYSKITEGIGTALYLCPDKQLLDQAKQQAQLYGIPVCEIELVDNKNHFPSEFINGKSILLCTFQKLFNPRNIFDRDQINLGAIVIDDAHSCLDISREATTVRIPTTHGAYQRLIKLFESELIKQAPGTYQRLTYGDPFARILKVPYWNWLEREREVINILNEFSSTDELEWKWGLISDELSTFECFLGPNGFEIAPIQVPYFNIKAYNEAKHRYILSATFEDQIDLVKDFGIHKNSIVNALVPKDRKDVGERLILAPRRFDPSITNNEIRKLAKKYSESGINVIVLVASLDKASEWTPYGGEILNGDEIVQNIEKLKKSTQGLYILINRYDGVDLSGDMCRLLIIDGYPGFTSYREIYNETRLDSIKASLKAQIIEQGLGRAVRSGSDYCAVYLMGKELLQFLGNRSNLKYFSSVTRKQLELGLSLLDDQPKENSIQTLNEVTDLCLTKDTDWRLYHSKEIGKIGNEPINEQKIQALTIAQQEKDGIDLFRARNYVGAKNKILKGIIESYELNNKQKAWYFQLAAQMCYPESRSESNDLQIKSSSLAPNMLQTDHISYSKVSSHEEQATNVIKYINQFEKVFDLKLHFEQVFNNLQFSPDIDASKFENALAEVGKMIGYHTQEPEAEYGNGPDVLWGMNDGYYLILEAKSRATHSEITRDNVGQLLQSGEWFRQRYGTSKFSLVTLQSTHIKGWNVNISKNSKVIDDEILDKFRQNITQFINGIVNGGTLAITNFEVSKLLNSHKFTPSQFRTEYLKEISQRKN